MSYLYKCEYCNKEFSSISNLNNHKKFAKYCLQLQNKEIIDSFYCDNCDKEYTTKHALQRHKESCKGINQYEKEIELLKNEIKNRDEEIQKLKIKLYRCENLVPFNQDVVINYMKSFDFNNIYLSEEYYVEWSLLFLKKSCICINPLKKIVMWKLSNDNESNKEVLIKDCKCQKLIQLIFSCIYYKHNKFLKKEIKKLEKKIEEFDNENENEEKNDGKNSEYMYIQYKLDQLFKIKDGIYNCMINNECAFSNKYAKLLCKNLLEIK